MTTLVCALDEPGMDSHDLEGGDLYGYGADHEERHAAEEVREAMPALESEPSDQSSTVSSDHLSDAWSSMMDSSQ